DEVDEEATRLDVALVARAVHVDGDAAAGLEGSHRDLACSIARVTTTSATAAWMSPFSLPSTSVALCGTASTQPRATRGPRSSDTAAETMQVPSRPIVTDAKPSRRPGGMCTLVRISPGPAAVMYTPRKNS